MSLNKFVDSEVELRRVDGVNAPVGSRGPVYNNFLCWLSISIKIHVVKPLSPVSKLSTETESVGSRRELVANCVHTADADATQLDS